MTTSSCRGRFAYHVFKPAALIFAAAVSSAAPARSLSQQTAPQIMAAGPSTAEQSTANKLVFEVASVRPGKKSFIKGVDFLDPVNKAAPPKGGLFSWNVPLAYLIYFAYDLRDSHVRRAIWTELPKWTQEEWYDVEARADRDPSRDDVRQMVRSLLEDRFKLAAHSGTRDGQVNALTVGRPGVGLRPHADGAACELDLPVANSAYPPYKDFPVRCGIFNRQLGKYTRRIEMVNVTMQQVADTISGQSPLPVVDRTGLTGRYDGFVDYGLDIIPPETDAAVEVGSPISIALEKQLGLKLVKQNAAVEYFVVDHIEKPSEN